MKNNHIHFAHTFMYGEKKRDPDLERVMMRRAQIEEELPQGQFTPDDLKEVCQRYGFYSYHLVKHLVVLNAIRQVNTNLYERV